ncbi:alpha/beta fold hydrolase [Lentzea sp. NPDC051838]|uniref:alpha/beta hydrolase n=1 Tax=Lentzea sp. NPDC051838 TaxID=3154849 RepID=UPI00344A2599
MRALVAALLLALCTPATAQAAGCEEFISPAGMYTRLCDPGSDTAVVLVPGASYNSAYWDFPYEPATYSFSRELNVRGHATATVDRLGTGSSIKPLGVTVTAMRQAAAVNEVVQSLRDKGFGKVVLAGHSLGSMIAILSAATFHNVDGVVVTGATHAIDPLAVVTILGSKVEPRSLLDPAYLTTKEGERYNAFHTPGDVDPQVIATDEATKDVFSAAEAPDGLSLGVVLPYSALIDVPVLIAVGEKDSVFCTALARDCSTAQRLVEQERPYYAGSPDVRGYVLQGAGHDANLHPRAKELQRAVADWISDVS